MRVFVAREFKVYGAHRVSTAENVEGLKDSGGIGFLGSSVDFVDLQ